jgi:2-hydroxy-6-oxonona-2,4-dienedioate hydrolase
MKLKKRYLLLLSFAALLLATTAGLYIAYRIDLSAIEAALPGDSLIAETSRGRVEYKMSAPTPNYTLMVHGTPGSYRFASAEVDQNRTLLSPSRPGYFRTPLTSGATPEEQADLFAALLDKLGIKSTVVLGISGGGPAALQFAIRHPEKCQALILWSAFSMAVPAFEERAPASFKFWLFVQYLRLVIKDKAAADGIRRYLFENAFPLAQSEPGWNNDGAQFIKLPDYALQKIACPTLIIHGDADKNVDISHGKNVAAKAPHAKLITLEGKDHGALFSHRKLFQEPTQQFLRNLNPKRSAE